MEGYKGDYLAGFVPDFIENEEPREIILKLGKMVTNRIPVKLGMQKLNKYDPEYWGLAMLLTDEMAEVAKMISRADVCRIAVDPYRHSRLAFAIAEMDDNQKEAQIRNNYRRAGTKIFWLNSMCRIMTGRPFIAHKLDPKSESDVGALVDSFEYVIRYAAATSTK